MIYPACTNYVSKSKISAIMREIGISSSYCRVRQLTDGINIINMVIITYKPTGNKDCRCRIDLLKVISIIDFCHSDKGSSIDSSFDGVLCLNINVKEEPHIKRVYNA